MLWTASAHGWVDHKPKAKEVNFVREKARKKNEGDQENSWNAWTKTPVDTETSSFARNICSVEVVIRVWYIWSKVGKGSVLDPVVIRRFFFLSFPPRPVQTRRLLTLTSPCMCCSWLSQHWRPRCLVFVLDIWFRFTSYPHARISLTRQITYSFSSYFLAECERTPTCTGFSNCQKSSVEKICALLYHLQVSRGQFFPKSPPAAPKQITHVPHHPRDSLLTKELFYKAPLLCSFLANSLFPGNLKLTLGFLFLCRPTVSLPQHSFLPNLKYISS